MTTSAPPRTSFEHLGMFYRDAGQYLAGTVAFVRAALAAGRPVLVAVPGANVELLRPELPAHGAELTFLDMHAAGRNPGRIIPAVLLAFAAGHPGRRVAIVGEPSCSGSSEVEYPACLLHEALINLAFSGFDASILCPYDATRLAPHVLADVACTHPVLADPARQWASRSYADPTVTATRCNLPLPEPPPYARAVTYADVGALGSLRHFAQEQAVRAGLGPGQVGDFTFAVNELVTNTLEHTVGTGRLTAWTEPGLLVCQVDDEGRLADPLAGRIPPLPVQDGGRGLILVNQLCDLVRVYHRPAGTTVRIWMRTGEAG